MIKKYCISFLFVVCLVPFSACSKQVPMSGKVTFSDDQSPLTCGTVFFETDTFQARGEIKPDGTYTIGTHSEKDGLPPGTYRVFVVGATVQDPSVQPGPNRPPIILPLIDPKFETGRTSGLTVNVGPSTKRFDFSVDPNTTTKTKLEKQNSY